jgi:hypothetical protein
MNGIKTEDSWLQLKHLKYFLKKDALILAIVRAVIRNIVSIAIKFFQVSHPLQASSLKRYPKKHHGK